VWGLFVVRAIGGNDSVISKFGFIGLLGFLVLCLPQRGRGTAERWMRRAGYGFLMGRRFFFAYQ
jgi:hypothetical protein